MYFPGRECEKVLTDAQFRNTFQNTYQQDCRLRKTFSGSCHDGDKICHWPPKWEFTSSSYQISDFCLEWNSRETRPQLEISPTQAESIIVWAVILADGFSHLQELCFISWFNSSSDNSLFNGVIFSFELLTVSP